MNKKPYIAVDGGEGSGKSTLVKLLAEIYGDRILLTREPGGSPDGKAIRYLALTHPLAKEASTETLLYLMFADRFDHVDKVIVPAIASGKAVVTDRSDLSTYAYQVVAGDDWQRASDAYWRLRLKLPRLPDLYVVMDVDPKVGLARRRNAGDMNHLDSRPLKFHENVRQGLLEFKDKVKERVVIIDANRPFEEVKAEFLAVIRKEIGE